eukprot:2628073-Prymnesium_polylepis.1
MECACWSGGPLGAAQITAPFGSLLAEKSRFLFSLHALHVPQRTHHPADGFMASGALPDRLHADGAPDRCRGAPVFSPRLSLAGFDQHHPHHAH